MNLCLGGPTALCALRICRTHNISPRGKTVVRPASPAPYKCWTRKRLHEGLAPIEGLADAIGGEPIHVCVPSKNERVQSSSVRNIVCAPAWYRSPFVRVTDSLSYASPGLLFAQVAARLSLEQAALIAYELCGTYAYDPCSGTMLYGVEPACSVSELLAFLRDMPGRLGPRRKLERALYYVRDNSWSPMESVLALLLSLPLKGGGYEISRIALNRRAPHDEGPCARIPDILFGSSKVGINYEGEGHFGTRELTDAAMRAAADASAEALDRIYEAGQSVRSRIVRDKQRDRELLMAGYKVIPVTKEDLYDQAVLDDIVWQLCQMKAEEQGVTRPTKGSVVGGKREQAKRRALIARLMRPQK